MGELVRQESFLGNRKNFVGDKSTDLVLETIGKVYIKTQNKSRLLNDLFTAIDNLEEGTNIIVLEDGQTTATITYPGDGKLVYDSSLGILYITLNNEYIELVNSGKSEGYVLRTGDTMTGSLTIELKDISSPPLIINSTNLVNNLNAELLDGKKSSEYAIKSNNEDISGDWVFSGKNTFNRDNTFNGGSYYNGNLESAGGFEGGMSGYGWQLDFQTNTLTVDYLVVRKIAQFNQDAEEIANQIVAGANGSLWSSMSTTINGVTDITTDDIYKISKITAQGERVSYTKGTIGSSEDLMDLHEDEFSYDNNYNEIYNYWDYFQGEYYSLDLSNELVQLNDILRCYKNSPDGKRYYDCVVTSNLEMVIVRCSTLNNNTYTKLPELAKTTENFSSDLTEEPDEETAPPEEEVSESNYILYPTLGDVLVKIGNLNGAVGLYQTWIEDDSPSLNLYDNIDTPNYKELKEKVIEVENPETGATEQKVIKESSLNTRIGVLNNIYDTVLKPSGVGLYSANSFTKGEWFVGSGTTGWSASGGSIKFLNEGVNSGLILGSDGKIDSANADFELFTDNVKFPLRLRADWEEDDENKVSHILNKPDIYLKSEVDQLFITNQSDWNTTNTTSPSYIKNKPDFGSVGTWTKRQISAASGSHTFEAIMKTNPVIGMYVFTFVMPMGAVLENWTGEDYRGTTIFSGDNWSTLLGGVPISYTTCIQNTPRYTEHNRGINLYVTNSNLKLCGQSCNDATMAMVNSHWYITICGTIAL